MTRMMIRYFDIANTAEHLLKDYRDQEWSLTYCKQQIKRLEAKAKRITSDLSKGHSKVYGNEAHFTDTVAEIDVYKQKYADAVDYFNGFNPAWERMTEDERSLLTARYIDKYMDSGSMKRIMQEMHLSKTQAYKLADDALNKFARYLFW